MTALAHIIIQSGIANVVLHDIIEGVPQGKALDLAESPARLFLKCPWSSSYGK